MKKCVRKHQKFEKSQISMLEMWTQAFERGKSLLERGISVLERERVLLESGTSLLEIRKAC
jgi:hypothetical protein